MSRTAENGNRHTMQVDGWMWEQAKQKWGVDNPAPRLREWMAGQWVKELGQQTKPQPNRSNDPPWKGPDEDGPEEPGGPWGSDRMLADEWDFAIYSLDKTQKKWYVLQHWPYDVLEKHPDDIADFLEDLANRDGWDSLSTGQKGLLGCCRKAHYNWMKHETRRRKD